MQGFHQLNISVMSCSNKAFHLDIKFHKNTTWGPAWYGSVGCHHAKQKVTGSIPGQDTCWVEGSVPGWACLRGDDRYFFLTTMFLSFPSPLSKNKLKI